MESGARSLLPDRMDVPKPHFPLRLDDSATSMLPDRGKSPLTMALDATTSQLNAVAESFKAHFPHASDGTKSFLLQNLEGTMALLAARGVEAPKGLYPISLDGLRPFLPYGGTSGGETVKSYLQERLDKPHKSVRDRKDSKCSGDRTSTTTSSSSSSSIPSSSLSSIGVDVKRLHHHHHHHHDRSREHKSNSSSHSLKKVTLPKSQLSNPRHDAHLTHAIRELHDEEFGLDAVLLAEGGHVGAHCAVLAAASPFLKNILLHANDHPAIISVTGTSLSTLQSLVTCLYTGNIPNGASLYHLIEAAKLLKMDDLATVLQKTYFAQGGSLDAPPRSQHLPLSSQRCTTTTTTTQQGLLSALEPPTEKFGKKGRSNRLDQILYQKLNVNHLAPSDMPDPLPPHPPPPSLVPPSQEPSRVPPLFDCSRVPLLESPRIPPDQGGILGELLTKADPLRSIFSNPNLYAGIPDLTFDASRASTLKPLNLSKSSKSETMSSSAASTISSTSTTTTTSILSSTTTSCSPSSSMASSLASQTDLTLAGLTSLAPTLPGNMPGLLSPLAPNISSMISPSALAASLTTSTALASLGAQQHPSLSSKSKSSSCGNGNSRSRSSTKGSCSGRSSSTGSCNTSTSRSSDSTGNSSHSLPLLYTLKGGMMSPEMAKEVYEQLKMNPQLSSLAGFNSIPNLSTLTSSASLQSLANLHNLPNLQNFPSLFPFLASATENSQMSTVESSNNGVSSDKVIQSSSTDTSSATATPSDYGLGVNPVSLNTSNMSSNVAAEDGVLNLSSSAQPAHSESPGTATTSMAVSTAAAASSSSPEEITIPSTPSDVNGEQTSTNTNTSPIENKEDKTETAPPAITNVSTGCQTVGGPIDPSDTLNTVVASSSDMNCTLSNGCPVSEEAKASLLSGQLDASNLPLLLMHSSGTLGTLGQSHASVAGSMDASPDVQSFLPKDSSEGVDTGDDTSSIEVVDEIPGISQALQNRKALFHAGPMGRKRKGCGDCEGCQVVEDCGQCRFCRDKAKFGGPNRLKQVCVYKRCVHAELEPEDSKKKRKSSGKKGRGKCGGCDGCQRTSDCNECYACLHNAAAQPPARRKVCEMRVCEQQQMEEVRATLSVAGEPSPYSTDSLMAEGINISSGASSPTPDNQPSTHNDKMKLMRKMLKKKFAQPYSRVSPSKVRTKYYCGECPGCQTTTPCGNCLYCEDMPKFGGPGRYRQKCVKQLCVYHPRLQALKLSNRSKVTYDEQHIAPETLNHLGTNVIQSGPEETMALGCEINPDHINPDHMNPDHINPDHINPDHINPDHLTPDHINRDHLTPDHMNPEHLKSEEYERLRSLENVEPDLTEGEEDSNATMPVEAILEEPSNDKPIDLIDIENPPSDDYNPPEIMSGIGTPISKTDEPVIIPPNPEPLPMSVNTIDSPASRMSTSPTCIQGPLAPETVYESSPAPPQPPITTFAGVTNFPSVSDIKATTPLPIPMNPISTSVPESKVSSPPVTRTPSPTEQNTPVVVPPPPPPPTASEVETVEDDEPDPDDDDDDAGSDGSDGHSSPSPPPKTRGRGRNRGRNRHVKSSRHAGSPTKKGLQQQQQLQEQSQQVMRRGRRRRTTRFTLDLDDNSDFEDQLALAEMQDENSTEGSVSGSHMTDSIQSDAGLGEAARGEVSLDPSVLETGSSTKQSFSSAPFVGRGKPMDPDVFEFHDSQDNVITSSHETSSYSLKHNSPFVFRDEESSQGGRDVNENLGTVGETASA